MLSYLYNPLHYSTVFCLAPDSLTGGSLKSALQDCRRQTLDLCKGMTCKTFRMQSHPDFSPVGWHLGHIAYTESLWIAEHLAGLPKPFSQYERLFAADGLPKSERQNLPELKEVLAYLQAVRSQTLNFLNHYYNPKDIGLWHWLIQHESQHAETITMVLAMHQRNCDTSVYPAVYPAVRLVSSPENNGMVYVPAGSATIGWDAPEAIDNERPAHLVSTEDYWIDRAPVTCGQYREFVEAGGYHNARWWNEAGWRWLKSVQIDRPFYWPYETPPESTLPGNTLPDNTLPDRAPSDQRTWDDHFVCGVSWYEADAYARYIGKRLPTEVEWEKAMTLENGCDRTTTGNLELSPVWEWTDTWFSAYEGFQPFPYRGYSQIYFDGEHRVLKGRSWATPRWVIRPSFRNWYHPHRREVFAGFRCARS